MEIQLRQLRHKAISGNGLTETIIEGQIFIEGQYICDTLQNEINSLPKGKYIIQVEKCKYRSRKMPLVIASQQQPSLSPSQSLNCDQCYKPKEVSMNSSPKKVPINHKPSSINQEIFCPQLTPGNGACNRHDGCILVGKRGAHGLLLHPKSTFDQLYERIRKNKERGQEVTLTIQ